MEPFTAFLFALSAVLTPVSVIIGYFKTKKKVVKTEERVEEVHGLVNSKMADALAKISELETALKEARGRKSPRSVGHPAARTQTKAGS